MSQLTLAGAWEKVERAREHTHALEQLAEAFVKRRPNQIFFDKHTELPWVQLRIAVEPPPLRIATVAGDAIQNLRAALDHLVWQVVLSEGEQPGRHTCFPIYVSEFEFEKKVRKPPEGRRGPLHGIDPSGDKWAIIEGFQPYHSARPLVDPLATIAALSNADKHRTLLAGMSLIRDFDIEALTEIIGLDISEFTASAKADDILRHDAEIARFRPTTPGRMEMKSDLPFEIALSDGDLDTPDDVDTIVVPIRLFDLLRSHVVRVIRSFEPILGV